MGEHIDNRSKEPRRKKMNEGTDILARKRRVTFKNFVRGLEEDLLEDDLDTDIDDIEDDTPIDHDVE